MKKTYWLKSKGKKSKGKASYIYIRFKVRGNQVQIRGITGISRRIHKTLNIEQARSYWKDRTEKGWQEAKEPQHFNFDTVYYAY